MANSKDVVVTGVSTGIGWQVLLEFQRDWARKEHYEEVMAVVKEHCGAYGQGIEYAATMVQKAPASRKRQTSNTKII